MYVSLYHMDTAHANVHAVEVANDITCILYNHFFFNSAKIRPAESEKHKIKLPRKMLDPDF